MSATTPSIMILLVCLCAGVHVTQVVYFPAFDSNSNLSFSRVGHVSENSAKILIHTSDAADFTTVVTVTKLQLSTAYNYSLSNGVTGSFTTAPRSGVGSGLIFVTSSCIKPGFPYNPLSPFSNARTVFGLQYLAKWIPQIRASFTLFLGDFIYIDVPHRHDSDVETYRREYRRVYASPDWAPAAKTLPWIHVIDDHEVANDWYKGFEEPYSSAIDPWDIYHASVNPPSVRENSSYCHFTSGPASFFMLDTRRFRVPSGLSPANATEKTMLGSNQLASLLSFLSRKEAPGVRWKFVISSIPFTRNWRINSIDTWAGYLHERQTILEAMWDVELRGDGIGVVVLSGDRHEFAATPFPPPAGSKWPPSATVHEFSTSPLSMFYLPFRSYWEDEGDEPREECVRYIPDGNSKFGIVDLGGEEPATLHFRLIVDGVAKWEHTLEAPPLGRREP